MTDSPKPGPRPAARSARRRSREFALQGLYQWLLNHTDTGVVDAHMREQTDFRKCDAKHYEALLHGCIAELAQLDGVIEPFVDRKLVELSPVEHATLLIGTFELRHFPDVPYKVVINEGVELAKVFGGTDGHKYVNGVLDKIAASVRPAEVTARRAAGR